MGSAVDAVAGTEAGSQARAGEPPIAVRLTISAGLFGIVLPWVCLLLDPCVFKADSIPMLGDTLTLGMAPMFPHTRAAAWVFVGIQTGALILHAFGRWRAPAWQALFAGIFLLGALGALALGVALLPLSVIGIAFMGIGLLGLVPFITSFVFLARARGALRRSQVWRSRQRAVVLLLGMSFAAGVPLLTRAAGRSLMNGTIESLTDGDSLATNVAVERLRWGRWLVTMDDLVIAWDQARDPDVRKRMAEAYEVVAGESIEERSAERRRVEID